jgi:hypothetical protein
MSDDEIKQDLLEQRMEKAASAELANSSNVIKHTGMFDIVDRVYGDFKLALKGGGGDGAEGEGGEESSGGGGGGGLGGAFGGGGAGGEDLDFGDEGESEAATEAGGEEGAAGAEAGAEEAATEAGAEEAAPTEVTESVKKVQNILKEQKVVLAKKLDERTKKYQGKFMERLIESVKSTPKEQVEKIKIYDKNVKVNKEIDEMINDIDKMLDE